MDTGEILGLGGPPALVAVVAWVVVQLMKIKTDDAPTRDISTANAVLMHTVDQLQDENQRLQNRVDLLEAKLSERDRVIADLEARLHAAEDQLRSVRHDLSHLKDDDL